jgi:hypothetical protein
MCGALIAWGVVVMNATASTPPMPVALGNPSEAHIVEIRAASGVTVAFGEFRSSTDAVGNTEKDAALFNRRGHALVGEVEVEIPAPGRPNRRPELEVDVIGLAPRETFAVVIDDRVVAMFDTDDRGSIDMELQEGEIPPQPASGS